MATPSNQESALRPNLGRQTSGAPTVIPSSANTCARSTFTGPHPATPPCPTDQELYNVIVTIGKIRDVLPKLQEVPSLIDAINSHIAARGRDQAEYNIRLSHANQLYATAYQQNAMLKEGTKDCQMYHETTISQLEEQVEELKVQNAKLASQHETDTAFMESLKREYDIVELDDRKAKKRKAAKV